ncbi:MAG: glycosyltransferase family 4 protein [Chitinispirillaceae bacterium]|nr:glycosyltransferase family 4 protein [Chitinispirillaceae bacterium]
MKVAHILYSYLPVTQNWIYTQITFNKEVQNSVISLTEENPQHFPFPQRYTAFRKEILLERIYLLMARYWICQPLLFFEKIICNINPDIIHGHFSTESWRILPIAQKHNLPLVTTFYGLDVDKLPRRYQWKKRYQKLFSYGKIFIVEGPFMKKRLVASGCPETKIKIIPIGVNPELYYSEKKENSLQNKDNKLINILFVGLEREKKGPLDAAKIFIEASKEESNLKLHIIGDGKYKDKLKNMFKEASLLDKVNFYGYLSFNQYLKILKSCDILLAPSCYAKDGDSEGGAPVVCIEAQMAGIPVVGTTHCDIPFVVKNGVSGLLSREHDVPNLTRDLLFLARNEIVRIKMGEEGKKHSISQHDYHNTIREINLIYTSISNKNEK